MNDQKCLACHATSADSGAKSAGSFKPCPLGKKDCVNCHMPKYDPPAMHFTFTDHWIRIVRPGEVYPE